MECATKAGLCRRLSRRVNMTARKNPVKAPRNASVIERLLNVRSPWLVRMNPVYAMARVQRIARTENMGDHLLMSKYCHNSPLWSESFCGLPKGWRLWRFAFLPARSVDRPRPPVNEFYEKGCQEKSSAFHRPWQDCF